MSLPRHILMTTDSVGGVWTYSLELVRALARYGIRVTLFTEGRPLTRSQRFAVSSLMNCNVHETGHRLEWMPEPWAEVDAAGAELQALAERVQPDLVHLNGYAHAALPWSQPLLVVAHSCVYSWFDAVRSTAPGTGWGEYWRRTRSALGRAQAVVAPSRAMVEAIEKHYGPVERITVIHNAASGRDFRAAEKQPFVLAAGRLWDEAKNLRALLEAAPGIPWPVRIAARCCLRWVLAKCPLNWRA
jgi:glycosyltransferase involved in cell wall biosynthesis